MRNCSYTLGIYNKIQKLICLLVQLNVHKNIISSYMHVVVTQEMTLKTPLYKIHRNAEKY